MCIRAVLVQKIMLVDFILTRHIYFPFCKRLDVLVGQKIIQLQTPIIQLESRVSPQSLVLMPRKSRREKFPHSLTFIVE